ncbi:MAG: 16S rRNA (cytosine(1402)-N(4))-methyltransferase RsmH [Clostridia bacterium]|nr:16S rRNA (cytosine(1402)-N(4))-methyltransferase RsmH [Clostridia bacterium]
MEFSHIPVLFQQTINSLDIKSNGIYIDGTAGGGGHSSAILNRLDQNGKLFCLDRDPDAIEVCTARFSGDPRVTVIRTNYSDMESALPDDMKGKVSGILLDIGVSSHQLDIPERGFSYHNDAPLDMRMSQSGMTAADVVNSYSWQALAGIFTKYGEERYSAPIAKAICLQRENEPITTTLRLAEIISSAVPAHARRNGHPARKVFQALRIEVNGELTELEKGMDAALEMLAPGGRLAVITFHSLEDRIVKTKMADWCKGCICPPEFPVCTCGNKPKARLAFKKPVEPSEQEIADNPRSRSSKLRVSIKL